MYRFIVRIVLVAVAAVCLQLNIYAEDWKTYRAKSVMYLIIRRTGPLQAGPQMTCGNMLFLPMVPQA